jgi:hypothetical protein
VKNELTPFIRNKLRNDYKWKENPLQKYKRKKQLAGKIFSTRRQVEKFYVGKTSEKSKANKRHYFYFCFSLETIFPEIRFLCLSALMFKQNI